MKKKLFPVILLLVCWIFNMLECLFSSTRDFCLSNIVTIKSFVFALIISIIFSFVNHEEVGKRQ